MKDNEMLVIIDGLVAARKIDHYEIDSLGPSSSMIPPKPVPKLFDDEELIEQYNEYPIIIKV